MIALIAIYDYIRFVTGEIIVSEKILMQASMDESRLETPSLKLKRIIEPLRCA